MTEFPHNIIKRGRDENNSQPGVSIWSAPDKQVQGFALSKRYIRRL
jgi:hypothetical protein